MRSDKAKRKRPAGRRLPIVAMAAALLLLICSIVMAAVLMSGREASAEAIIMGYPERFHGRGFSSLELSGPEILHRRRLPELEAQLMLFKWRESGRAQVQLCVNALIVAEAQDNFGGWFIMQDGGPICGPDLAVTAPNMRRWQADAGQGSPHYALIYGIAYHRAKLLKLDLADGKQAHIATHGIAYAELISADEPIDIEHVHFLGADGLALAAFPYPSWWTPYDASLGDRQD